MEIIFVLVYNFIQIVLFTTFIRVILVKKRNEVRNYKRA